MNFVFFSKNNRKLPKMAKTKVVRETAKWHRSGAKVKRQVQTPRGVPKEGSFVISGFFLTF